MTVTDAGVERYTDIGPEPLHAFAAQVTDIAVEYREHPFKLRAGGESHWYIEMRRGLSEGTAEEFVGEMLLSRAAMLGIEYDAVAAAGVDGCAPLFGMAIVGHKRWAQINDKQKDRTLADDNYPYGIHPALSDGDRVLLVDSTLTSGSSLITSTKMIKGIRQGEDGWYYIEEGHRGIVEDALVVVDRSNGRAAEALKPLGVTIHSLFEFDETTGLIAPTGL